MKNLSAQRLRELLAYDQDAGLFTWRRARGNQPAGVRAGCAKQPKGYRVIRVDGRLYYEHRLAWLYVHGTWPEQEVDHKNGDTGDNRLANLRDATSSQNQMNARSRPGNTGVRGIYRRSDGTFVARIKRGGEVLALGCFDTLDKAAEVRRAAERDVHGAWAAT